MSIVGQPVISGNVTAAIQTGDTPATATATGVQTAPAIALTGVAVFNPFPYKALVRVVGGTITSVQLNATSVAGAIAAGADCRILVPVGASLTINYSAAPTWTWIAEPD
jgi:hypothetical protein